MSTLMSRPAKLKPCPFCGGTKTMLYRSIMGFSVLCSGCTTTGPWKDLKEDDEAKAHAVAAWNRRKSSRVDFGAKRGHKGETMTKTRELKFRAWRPDEKEMIYNEFHICSDGSTYSFGPDPLLILKQYTGLKDKNGKEIYEGDLIKVVNAEYPDGIVAKIDFCNDPQHMSWVAEVPYGHGAQKLEFWWPTCEVIGNIYENPELLEEKQ